jgi:PHP family Zn ribbon phosphoesterase
VSNLNPEQFKKDTPSKGSPKMTAKCGHEDALGYFAGTVCGKCARRNQKKAMGK